MTVVLDADVLIGALDADDAHHRQARRRFVAWEEQGTPRVVSALTLCEVLAGPAADPERLRRARRAIAVLGARLHAPGETEVVDAARLRARHPISLADAFCLSTARRLGGGLVSFDRKVLRAAAREDIPLA